MNIKNRDNETLLTPTLRATIILIIATGFLYICSLWLQKSELIAHSCQISESVPPIPAVVLLILLILINPLLRQLNQRMAITRAEMLIIYCILAIAIPMASVGVIRYFFPCLVTLFYFATPQNEFGLYHKYIPNWFLPKNHEVLRTLYEGSDAAQVPWGFWLKPLLFWSVFFLCLWLIMLCLTAIFRHQWTEKERLTFPLLYLPLDITEQNSNKSTTPAFFKNPIMWIGFGAASLYNLLNILNAFNPSVAALGKFFDLGSLFTEKPLDALRGTVLHYRPEIIGFGYLVSLEVSFSIWFFYWLQRIGCIIARIIGYERAGFPFEQEQSIGAYIALAFFLIWVSREHIKTVFRKAFYNDQNIDDSQEPLPYRWAIIGLFSGIIFLAAWCNFVGMSLWVATLYFGIILAVALVYTRIRAETGIPNTWLFPFWQQEKVLINALGSTTVAFGGNFATLTIISVLAFLPRGYFPTLMAYQMESFKIADETQIKRRYMTFIIIFALFIGFAFASWIHLSSYYKFGANVLEGGYRTQLAIQEYQTLANYHKAPLPPNWLKTSFSGIGFLVVSGLTILRMIFLKFPIHPLGYAMSTAYGSLVWGSFFIVWLIKLIVFRLGGIKLYKRLIPGFLGLALGHFFTAGVLWGTFGVYFGETFRRYGVWFG